MDDLLETFSLFDDWTEKYAYIIELGKKLPVMPEDLKTDETKVSGCLSQVWIAHELKDGHVAFYGDSDAIIVKGLVGLLFELYDGKSPDEIQGIDIERFMEDVGLAGHLSPNRRNGFVSMVERIRSVRS